MIYKDKTFCASRTQNHTCGRELSKEEIEYLKTAEHERVSMAYFCPNQDTTNVLH